MDVSVWLIPELSQEKKLQQIINYLAEKYQAYPFIPHITLYHLPNFYDVQDLISFIDNKLKMIKNPTINFDRLQYSSVFTKTLFASFKLNKSINELYKIFHNQYKTINNYKLAPHLSLIYKNEMKEEDKLKEIALIKISQKLTLDRLYIITKKGETIKEDKDVLDWKLFYKLKLK